MTGPSETVENTRAPGTSDPSSLRAGVDSTAPVDKNANQRTLAQNVARREQWIVGQHGCGTDGNCVNLRALPVKIAICFLAGKEDAAAGHAHESVGGNCRFCNHIRAPLRHPGDECGVQAGC